MLLTLNGARCSSCLLVSTTGSELIVPSNVQYCSSTQSRAAAHPMWVVNWKTAGLEFAGELAAFNGGMTGSLALVSPAINVNIHIPYVATQMFSIMFQLIYYYKEHFNRGHNRSSWKEKRYWRRNRCVIAYPFGIAPVDLYRQVSDCNRLAPLTDWLALCRREPD